MYAIDVGYAKAPEHPFPAALEDAASALAWATAQEWCDGRVALVGWSAGGNIAIDFAAPGIASKYGLSQEQSDAIKTVVAVYPVTSLDADAREKSENNKSAEWLAEKGYPGTAFPRQVTGALVSAAWLYLLVLNG